MEVAANPFADAEVSQVDIHLQWLEDKLDEYLRLAKESGAFDGMSAVLLNDSATYQVGESGEPPLPVSGLPPFPQCQKGTFFGRGG